jgi:hypothetical protein
MAKRAGKAASRRARQRTVRRPPVPASSAAPAVPATESAARLTPAEAAPAPRASAMVARPAAGSQLTATERSEYHYVERDLRDIGILTAVMAALLFVAWLIFSASGLG